MQSVSSKSRTGDYRSPVDREAMARRRRRRQVEEALDDERSREAALAERLEEVVGEDGGARVDELAFARMEPDDVAVVREALADLLPFEGDEELDAAEAEELERARVEEVERLQDEIAHSRRRQAAFARYLEALE
jgi:hypothetical protein